MNQNNHVDARSRAGEKKVYWKLADQFWSDAVGAKLYLIYRGACVRICTCYISKGYFHGICMRCVVLFVAYERNYMVKKTRHTVTSLRIVTNKPYMQTSYTTDLRIIAAPRNRVGCCCVPIGVGSMNELEWNETGRIHCWPIWVLCVMGSDVRWV